MLGKYVSIIIGCMILTTSCSLNVLAQDKGGSSVDKRITIKMTKKSLYTVFYRLIQKHDVAIGFEESILDRDHRHYYFETNVMTNEQKAEWGTDGDISPVQDCDEPLINVDFKDTRLEVVMDSIVKQLEHYDWEMNNGVVNIFPIRGRDPRLKKLMDIKVSDFAVGMGDQVGSAQAYIMLFLPEFKSFIAEHKLKARTDRPGSILGSRILPDGMRFQNMTFKELLNAITKSKRGGWKLQIKNVKGETTKEFIEILI